MLYYKMSLNPDSVCMEGPSAKLSFNINAFNGNTTHFNRCPRPTPKTVPVQPRGELPMPLLNQPTIRPPMIIPL